MAMYQFQSGSMESCGYTGKDDRVAQAVSHMFGLEVAARSLSTPVVGGTTVDHGDKVANIAAQLQSGGIQLG